MNQIEEALKDDRKWTVYSHINKFNSKMYIGITSVNPKERWKNGKGYKGQVFYKAIEKYSFDGFYHEIVSSNLTKEEAENFEIYLIDVLDSRCPNGYNISIGGGSNKGYIASEETRKKISDANTGKVRTEEMKIKYREANLGENNPSYGKRASEETKKKMSESQSGEKAFWYGKTMSEEVKDKIRETKIKNGSNVFSDEHKAKLSKPIICLTTMIEYKSAIEVERLGIADRGGISKCCKGKQKHCGKLEDGTKLSWMYLEDYKKLNYKESEVI